MKTNKQNKKNKKQAACNIYLNACVCSCRLSITLILQILQTSHVTANAKKIGLGLFLLVFICKGFLWACKAMSLRDIKKKKKPDPIL